MTRSKSDRSFRKRRRNELETPALLNMTWSPPKWPTAKSTSSSDLLRVGHIGPFEHGRLARASGQLLAPLDIHVGDDDLRPFVDEQLDGGPADPARSPGDDRHLAGELLVDQLVSPVHRPRCAADGQPRCSRATSFVRCSGSSTCKHYSLSAANGADDGAAEEAEARAEYRIAALRKARRRPWRHAVRTIALDTALSYHANRVINDDQTRCRGDARPDGGHPDFGGSPRSSRRPSPGVLATLDASGVGGAPPRVQVNAQVDVPSSIDPLDLVEPSRFAQNGYPHAVWATLRARGAGGLSDAARVMSRSGPSRSTPTSWRSRPSPSSSRTHRA